MVFAHCLLHGEWPAFSTTCKIPVHVMVINEPCLVSY